MVCCQLHSMTNSHPEANLEDSLCLATPTLPMHLPMHACLHACKPCCIIARGHDLLADVAASRNCGGRSGSCPGLVDGPSRENAIATVHAVGCIAAHITTGVLLVLTQKQHIRVHGAVTLVLYTPMVLPPLLRCVMATWPLVVRLV